MNLRLNLKYLALLAAALMLTVVMAFTAYSIVESNIASAKSAKQAYKQPNAGRGNDCEFASNRNPCEEGTPDRDPGRSGNNRGGG